MNIRTILVPVDFSSCSLLVTRQAAALAKQLDARVVILHVAELPPGLSPETLVKPDGVEQTASAYVEADVRARLDPFLALAKSEGARVEVAVAWGPVVPAILGATDRTAADLIVLGTHGRTGLARLVLGSVAEGVSHQAHVPVMLVRREVRPECGRESCDWCAVDGRSPAEDRIAAESQG